MYTMKKRPILLLLWLYITIWAPYRTIKKIMNGGLSENAPLSFKALTAFDIMVSLALLILFPISLIQFIQEKDSSSESKSDLNKPSQQ